MSQDPNTPQDGDLPQDDHVPEDYAEDSSSSSSEEEEELINLMGPADGPHRGVKRAGDTLSRDGTAKRRDTDGRAHAENKNTAHHAGASLAPGAAPPSDPEDLALVDFEFFDPRPSDYWSVKNFVRWYTDAQQDFNAKALANCISDQGSLGTMVHAGGRDETDSREGGGAAPSAATTATATTTTATTSGGDGNAMAEPRNYAFGFATLLPIDMYYSPGTIGNYLREVQRKVRARQRKRQRILQLQRKYAAADAARARKKDEARADKQGSSNEPARGAGQATAGGRAQRRAPREIVLPVNDTDLYTHSFMQIRDWLTAQCRKHCTHQATRDAILGLWERACPGELQHSVTSTLQRPAGDSTDKKHASGGASEQKHSVKSHKKTQQSWPAANSKCLLLVQDRIMNMPMQLVAPMHQSLLQDLQWAAKHDSDQAFRGSLAAAEWVLVVSRMWSAEVDLGMANRLTGPSDSQGKRTKKQKKKQGKDGLRNSDTPTSQLPVGYVFYHVEDQHIYTHARFAFHFPVPEASGDTESAIAAMPQRRMCMLVPRAAWESKVVPAIQQAYGGIQ